MTYFLKRKQIVPTLGLALVALWFTSFAGAQDEQPWSAAVEQFDRGEHEAALKVLMPLAEQGVAEAQYYVGQAYLLGYSVETDEAEARRWLHLAADQDHGEALTYLAIVYDIAEDDTRDLQKSWELFQKAAQLGDQGAWTNLGVRYYLGTEIVEKDYEKASEYFLKAADANTSNPIALYYLGLMKWYGQATTVDRKVGAQFIKAAAQLGFDKAQFDHAKFLRHGEGVEANEQEAFSWYEKAANQDHAAAQWEMGMYYVRGEMVEQSGEQAVHWFRKAADQNLPRGLTSLAVMYATGDGVGQDYEQAYNYYLRAAEFGEADAAKNIAAMYLNGEHMAEDIYQAAIWYHIGSYLGSESAQQMVDVVRNQNSDEAMAEIEQAARDWLRTHGLTER